MPKLTECFVAVQPKEHINTNILENPKQSAYNQDHSTETAILSIKKDIHLSLSKGEPTVLVLLNLSAVFDTLDHDTLLSSCRLSEVAHHWQICVIFGIPLVSVF